MVFHFFSATLPNTRGFKPNEDIIICDSENRIAIVCDGVTQNHDEYKANSQTSDAQITSSIFATALYNSLLSGKTIEESTSFANTVVNLHNSGKKNAYPPALVFVCAQIKNNILDFSYIGDSLIYLLRNNARICLAEQQTLALSFIRQSKNISKDEIYKDIANNPQHPLGYGVITGDPSAISFLRHTHIELSSGDRVILASDGLDKYLRFTPPKDIITKSPSEILELSKVYDVPPYASYADDKSIVIIDVE